MFIERNEVLPDFICTRVMVENTLLESELMTEICNYT
jgi:hypothetical protein